MTAPPELPAGSGAQLRRLAVLIATNFVDMIGFAIILPLIPFYALELGATPLVVGVIISAFSVAQIVSAPFWGRFSDRYGRRPALMVGLLAAAAAYLVFGLADALWLLLASRVVQGLGGGTTGVAQAYVADTVPPHQRARALGWLSAATSAGVMLGPAIGSFAAHWGNAAPGFVAAALCLVNALFAWRWLPESRDAAAAPPRRHAWHAAWQVLRSPAVPAARLIRIYAGGMLAFSALTSVLALYLEAEFRVDKTTIGFFFAYTGALSLIMRSLLLGPIVDRLGEVWTMRIGTLVLLAGFLLYPLPASIPALALVIPLVPIGTALLFPSTTSLVSRVTDRAEYGTMMGVAQTFAGVARILAPLVATAAFQRLGHAAPFLVSAAVTAAVGLLAFRIAAPERAAGEPA